jgi:MarR-like DNA-binding transcriptional regulator SgrR of sgrS sRNA
VIRWVVSLLVAGSLVVLWDKMRPGLEKKESMKELNIYVPFIFSEQIDPRSVYTVGDQVVSEHVFAYHSSASIKKSTLELFSRITIDHSKNLVEIRPLREIRDNLGNLLTFEDICASVKSSFTGTQHTKYKSLVQSLTCKDGLIQIHMKAIPINLEYWLRSTDFAIYSTAKLPLKNSAENSSTGPYSVVSMSPSKVELKVNKFFPIEFTANRLEKVTLESYRPGELDSVLNLNEMHLAYMYGYSVNEEIMTKLKERNFKIQIFPNEWLMYLGFQRNLDFQTRNTIAAKIDSIRSSFQDKIVFGSTAYSTVPGDRAYGLRMDEYFQNIQKSSKIKIPKKLKFATLDEWARIPLFDFIINELAREFEIDVKLFQRKNLQDIYSSDEADFYLSPMGISAADPLGNYSFFLTYEELFKDALTEKNLVSLYQEKDFQRFASQVKDIELRLLKQRILVPLGHFPGIVIESPSLVRDEKKSWDWGIQAWAYKIN